MRKSQVALLASSTKLRKYLWPAEVGTENGPYTSICTKSKEESHIVLLKGKGNRFYFANGQTVHYLVQQFCKKEKMLFKDWSLTSKGWPSLECHKEYKLLWALL